MHAKDPLYSNFPAFTLNYQNLNNANPSMFLLLKSVGLPI